MSALRYVNSYAEWMSLAFIALSRCLGLVRRSWAQRNLTRHRGLLVILAIWAYALALVSLALTEVAGNSSSTAHSGVK